MLLAKQQQQESWNLKRNLALHPTLLRLAALIDMAVDAAVGAAAQPAPQEKRGKRYMYSVRETISVFGLRLRNRAVREAS